MQVSIVIPVLNEAERIERAICRAWQAGADEVIVVDGGSSDATCEVANASNCTLITSETGRAAQQNAGGRAANGDILLFLHADNWLVADGARQIIDACECDRSVVGGSFQQRIEAAGASYRLLEAGNRFRARVLRLPYGDQGLFIRSQVFREIDGFADVPLMEDVVLAKQMRHHGQTVHLRGPLHVDARRWQRHGVVRQTLRNWMLITAFHLGVAPQRLAQFYPRHDQAASHPLKVDRPASDTSVAISIE